jgi:DNA-directed RNA polymerase subunit M/transcription elongation factor TFIIS
MILLKCPKCGNKMKYQSRGDILTGKRKSCVYCGHSFKASEHIIKKLE